MEKVAIVVATYNGEKYLREQLESLRTQSYQNIAVYIHDDGSSDSTIDIINEYIAKSHPGCTFELLDQQSLRYPQCFIHTLLSIPEADYYAFCDQDDVWNKSKIADAVKALNKFGDKNLATLFYSAVDYYDGELNFIRGPRFVNKKKPIVSVYSLQELLLGGEAMGMTFVFNNQVRKVFNELVANGATDFKDTFIKIYCASCGRVIYSYKPCAKYRRHSDATTVGMNPAGKMQRIINMSKKIFIEKDGMESIQSSINYIQEQYKDKVFPENRSVLQCFAQPNTLQKRLKKCLSIKRYRLRLTDEIGYRIAFLLGRI